MYTLVGKEIKKGEYKGISYCHCVLYATTPCNEHGEGIRTYQFKAKDDPHYFYDRVNIGDKFKVFYDRFGNVVEISVQD